ncbi:hypothetical protein [Lentzea sp. NPDC092896]|uniref:hypothetical protein n=1 Tax=Lentzea sp. NPDC092896 TaxID=3364127 RepID=UPI0038224C90
MTGAQWRVVALIMAFGNSVRYLVVADGWEDLLKAAIWAVVFVVLGFCRVRERCGLRLPVVMPFGRFQHHVHHCASDHGHTSRTHKCRCSLAYTPLEVAS